MCVLSVATVRRSERAATVSKEHHRYTTLHKQWLRDVPIVPIVMMMMMTVVIVCLIIQHEKGKTLLIALTDVRFLSGRIIGSGSSGRLKQR